VLEVEEEATGGEPVHPVAAAAAAAEVGAVEAAAMIASVAILLEAEAVAEIETVGDAE